VFAGSFRADLVAAAQRGTRLDQQALGGRLDLKWSACHCQNFSSIKLSGTNVILSGTGGTPNAPYAVLTATNVTTPLSNWLEHF